MLALVLLVVAAPFFPAPILRYAADCWTSNQAPTQADVIIILGGQIASRPDRGADLYLQQWAPRVFISREDEIPLLHADTPGGERSRHVAAILRDKGVPPAVIHFSHDRAGSTWEEAVQFKQWRQALPPSQRIKKAILVTNDFHSRRALWTFRQQDYQQDLEFFAVTAPVEKYDTERWWASEHGRKDFASEIRKYFYYRLRYANEG